jgi:hypothetical protein
MVSSIVKFANKEIEAYLLRIREKEGEVGKALQLVDAESKLDRRLLPFKSLSYNYQDQQQIMSSSKLVEQHNIQITDQLQSLQLDVNLGVSSVRSEQIQPYDQMRLAHEGEFTRVIPKNPSPYSRVNIFQKRPRPNS